ncbi:DNA cytosine methyltransferase [Gammaproteobacteria bacterium]|nr:DNA cytosine methyltransferase [Gammaproteobacteria bacterium]
MPKNIKFIDLFAGIGGFHLAFHKLGAECVFASEIDPIAREVYENNFSKISPEIFPDFFNKDIYNQDTKDIPEFDVLCGGFPCQPFSQIGQRRGFKENYQGRGNLFFEITRIIEDKKPRAFFLENVQHIMNHDEGKTFNVIQETVRDLGYSFYYKKIRACDFGLPQLRPRTFMVGFRDEKQTEEFFSFPEPVPLKKTMSDIFDGECSREIGFTLRLGGMGSNIDDRRNWDSYLVDGEVVKLQTSQAKEMQGFPKKFKLPDSRSKSLKLLGNSVAVNAVHAVGKQIINYIDNKDSFKKGFQTKIF